MRSPTSPWGRSGTAAWCAVALAVAMLSACSSGGTTSSAAAEAPEAPTPGARLFADDFRDDHNSWALPENEAANLFVKHGDFVWFSKMENLRPHMIAKPLGDAFDRGELHMRNVVVDASFTPVRGKGVVGLFCREVRDTDADFQWYEFVVRDGYAAIRHSDSSGHLDVLAKTTDATVPKGERSDIQATCVDDAKGTAQLWLKLNGESTLYATDDRPLGSGAPGLQAYDAPANASAARLVVRWHDFTVSRPATG